MARVNKARAIERLEKLLDEASDLNPHDQSSQKFSKWTESIYSAFIHIFGEDSHQFSRLPKGHTITSKGMSDYFNSMVSMVASNLEDIKHFWREEEPTVHHMDWSECSKPNFNRHVDNRNTNKVFVIHGHDEAARETVARFLEKLGLEPVILHEQANKGHTIIEKFEDHADVAFAVVLLTPDDVGKGKGEKSDPKLRARQNVILELGFFLGRLGRKCVSPLSKEMWKRLPITTEWFIPRWTMRAPGR